MSGSFGCENATAVANYGGQAPWLPGTTLAAKVRTSVPVPARSWQWSDEAAPLAASLLVANW